MLLLTVVAAVACDHSPSEETTISVSPYEKCQTRAEGAAGMFSYEALQHSTDFVQFTEILNTLGSPYGVSRDLQWNGYEDEFEGLSGRSGWVDQHAHDTYAETMTECASEEGITTILDSDGVARDVLGGPVSDDGLPPPPGTGRPGFGDDPFRIESGPVWRELSDTEQLRIECAAKVLFGIQREHPLSDPVYASDFLEFLENDDSGATVSVERAYADATGRSPFRDPVGVDAFRVAARSC